MYLTNTSLVPCQCVDADTAYMKNTTLVPSQGVDSDNAYRTSNAPVPDSVYMHNTSAR